MTHGPQAQAQELQTEPTPLSAWIDLSQSPRRTAAWPIWLESVERHDGENQHLVRLRFRRFPHLNPQLMLRLHFRDQDQPVVSAWTETGLALLDSGPLGQGLGLPTFESVIVPMDRVDYVEIHAPGDGSNLLGVFLTTLAPTGSQAARDFSGALPAVLDPFGTPASRGAAENDMELFGRVRAPLFSGPQTLSADDPALVCEFDLEGAPLLAFVEFQVLNAPVSDSAQVVVNGRPMGAAALLLPDLADPAYRGISVPLQSGLQIVYAGWTTARTAIPGSMLRAGTNRIEIQRAPGPGDVAVRNIELQLKYNDTTFGYDLAPLRPLY